MTDKYEEKYLKYKQKYLELKSQIGGLSIGDKFTDKVSGKNGIILSKVPGNDADIKYKVRFDGESEDKELPRSKIVPKGFAAFRSAAKFAKKKTVIAANYAAEKSSDAAKFAAKTYTDNSPGVFAAVKAAALSTASTVSKVASATQAAVTKAVAPAAPAAAPAATAAAPAGDLNTQVKSILDASEY
jgi:hypothetical protein